MCQHLSLMWTSPQMTSTQRQPATTKMPQALKKHMVNPACVWKKQNRFYLLHILSSSISYCFPLLLLLLLLLWLPSSHMASLQQMICAAKGPKYQRKAHFKKTFGLRHQNTQTHTVRCVSVCAETQMGTRCHGATHWVTAPSPGSTVMSRPVGCLCVSKFGTGVEFFCGTLNFTLTHCT